MKHVDLDRACEAPNRALHEHEARRKLPGIADLVDQCRDACATLGEVVDGVSRDPEELRASETFERRAPAVVAAILVDEDAVGRERIRIHRPAPE